MMTWQTMSTGLNSALTLSFENALKIKNKKTPNQLKTPTKQKQPKQKHQEGALRSKKS